MESLKALLSAHPDLATAKIPGNDAGGRTPYVATDWPGHFLNVASTIAELIAHGAEVNARFTGWHTETPLHWAASSDDVEALDAPLDRGGDIEAPGSVIGGGTPLADAVAFGQWQAAQRLVERGAQTTLWQAAGLGLMSRIREFFAGDEPPTAEEITNAFWVACHGGQREAAEYLLSRGADLNWVGYDGLTPVDAANRSGAILKRAAELVEWLRGRGAKSAKASET